jgi:two-component system, OmpR family, sensor kinase
MTGERLRRALVKRGRPGRAQLRTRVLAGVLLITLVALVAFDIAAVTALHGYLLSQTDEQLQTVLRQYRSYPLKQPLLRQPQSSVRVQGGPAPRLSKRQRPFPPATGTKAPRPGGPHAGRIVIIPRHISVTITGPSLTLGAVLDEYYAAFVTSHGVAAVALLRGNSSLQPQFPADLDALAASHRAVTVTSSDGHDQLRMRAVREDGGTFVVTTSLRRVSRIVDQVRLIVIIGSAAAGLLVALSVAWLVRRGLRPIEVMARQADRITAGNLTDRVSPQDARTEVGRLGTALNGMLARIETSISEREASQELTRRFFADASHELRNPLASLRANAELYQQGALPSHEDVDVAMHRIALEARRMSGLVDDMLRLARLDQHPGRQGDPVDLTAVVREGTERARVADPARTWKADVAADLAVTGDEELLRRAIDNLLANVRTHTPAGTMATVTAARHDGAVVVDVSDDGPGVPASQLPRIFERFYRVPARTGAPGSGLGLAIVSATATAHDGTAVATLNDPCGLRVTLTLPAPALAAPGPAAASRPGQADGN